MFRRIFYGGAAVVLLLFLYAFTLGGGQRNGGDISFTAPPDNAVTFWGHSCFYIRLDGTGIVTDPMFAARYALVASRVVPVPPPELYKDTDFILVTHAHPDHLNGKTISRFPAGALILCSPAAATYLSGMKQKVKTMKPWEEVRAGGIIITAVPAYHAGGRYSLVRSGDGRALGFVIQADDATVYYSGDTNYFKGLEEIARKFRPTVAILNVNRHLPGPDAMRLVRLMDEALIIPGHFGAYRNFYAEEGKKWRALLRGPRYCELPVGGSIAIRRDKGGEG
jgi:L-ascorbate metabolism protein UlaG (beta-lactamase superfamily)